MIQLANDGTHKAHPSSTRRTQLAREVNYNEYGQHQEVDIARCVMLMQKIYERLSITPGFTRKLEGACGTSPDRLGDKFGLGTGYANYLYLY